MMQFIPTLSLTDHVNVWLANSRQPNILHVFERACNLINERKEVLSVVTPQIGNGPFNLVVESHICFSDCINLESSISISPAQLALGKLTIHIAGTKLWNPRPDWKSLHINRDKIADHVVELQITNYLKRSGFDTFFGEHSGLLNHRGLPIPQSLIANLSLALVNADISSARKLTSKLAGLGIGLTPSGDDFLMGAMYAAWIIHPSEVASVLTQEIANTAAQLTTSLSAAWLRSAGKGEAGIVWHEFFDALISTNTSRIQETTKNILAVGETSGGDALAGFCSVFLSCKEEAGSKDE